MILEDQLASAILHATAKACRVSSFKAIQLKSTVPSHVGLSIKPIVGVTTLINVPRFSKMPDGYEVGDADFKRVSYKGPMGVKSSILCAVLAVTPTDDTSTVYLFDVKVEIGSCILSVRYLG